MAEENLEPSPIKRATKEELLRLITDVVDVNIDGRIYGLRPITYAEDAEIERACSDHRNEDEKLRKRVILTVWKGLIDPKFSMEELDTLPVGLVTKIALQISNISAGVEKN